MDNDIEVRDAFCYCYRLSRDCFRLLEIIPNQDSAPLACKLRKYGWSGRTRRPPPYDSLSYTWNDEVATKEITCDGEIMLITLNLHQALWRIRQLGGTRFLWVDAICINQSDLTEKTAQVRQMTHIFSRSRKVIAWLGEEDESTGSVFQLMSDLNTRLSIPRKTKAQENIDLDVEAFGLPSLRNQAWIDLAMLLTRSWFQRIWVVQEIAVAPTGVFLCGRYQIERSIVFHATEILTAFTNIRLNFLHSRMMHEERGDNSLTGSGLKVIRELYTSQNLDLGRAILLTKTSKSSDLRDKIFALVGICKEIPDMFIDYDKDLRLVYTEAMKQLLSQPQGLRYLGLVSKFKSADLPSWVPDFSHPYFGVYFPLFHIYHDFRLRHQPIPSHRFASKEDLIVTGKIVDTIDMVIEKKFTYDTYEIVRDDQKVMERFTQIYDWIQQCEAMANLEQSYLDGSSTEEALRRALLFDTARSKQKNKQQLYQSYKAWRELIQVGAIGDFNRNSHEQRIREVLESGEGFRRDVVLGSSAIGFCVSFLSLSIWNNKLPRNLSGWLRVTSQCIVFMVALNLMASAHPSAISKEEEDAEDLDHRIDRLVKETKEADYIMEKWPAGRNVFRSTQKAIGWAPEDARPGDVILLIQGTQIPFVIRQCEGGYRLLGDCYLQSLMNGKAWDFYQGTVQEIRLI